MEQQQRLHYVIIPQLLHFVVFFRPWLKLESGRHYVSISIAFKFLFGTKYRIPKIKNIALKNK